MKTRLLTQKAPLLLMAVAASLIVAFGRHQGVTEAAVLAIFTLTAPAVYVMGRRLTATARQKETEVRLMVNTKTFLESEEWSSGPDAGALRPSAAESDIEILARVIDGSKLPTQVFRPYQAIPAELPVGETVVFDAFPRRYATRSLYARRLLGVARTMPEAVRRPLDSQLATARK